MVAQCGCTKDRKKTVALNKTFVCTLMIYYGRFATLERWRSRTLQIGQKFFSAPQRRSAIVHASLISNWSCSMIQHPNGWLKHAQLPKLYYQSPHYWTRANCKATRTPIICGAPSQFFWGTCHIMLLRICCIFTINLDLMYKVCTWKVLTAPEDIAGEHNSKLSLCPSGS